MFYTTDQEFTISYQTEKPHGTNPVNILLARPILLIGKLVYKNEAIQLSKDGVELLQNVSLDQLQETVLYNIFQPLFCLPEWSPLKDFTLMVGS